MTVMTAIRAQAGPGALPVLAVDLDGTLIRSDLLWETLLDRLAHDPRDALAALARLPAGRAALKARLAGDTALDVAHLPYRAEVLDLIAAHRAAGGRVALVTASDIRLAEAVAAHLGCFDEVHGSTPDRNLKGPAKAAFLAGRFGAGGFDYAGDSRADLAVWGRARQAVTVGAGPALRRAAEVAAPGALHLAPPTGRWRGHLKALRPHQWLKNLLVFLPALAAHATDPAVWAAACLAFVAFSLTASSVYVLNDLLDLGPDRAHPRKRRRPFASGAVPLVHGLAMAPGLLAAAVAVALAALPPVFLLVLAGYYALTLAYSLWIKRKLVADICALAGLYTARIMAGAAATGVMLSPWMLAFSGFLFLSLAAVKRQAELVDGIARGRDRAAGRAYQAGDLPIVAAMAIASGFLSVLVLALYIASPEVRALYPRPEILWAACPVLLYWISRTVMLAHRGRMTDDPVIYAVRDRVSLACGAAMAAVGIAAGL